MKVTFLWVMLVLSTSILAQESVPGERSDSLDVLSYIIPPFFKYYKDSIAVMEMVNSDTSVCRMKVYPSYPDSSIRQEAVRNAWASFVSGKLNGADARPGQVLRDTLRNGWSLTVAIGNYRQEGKRAVVFMYLFSKGDRKAVAVVHFSDRIFKQPVEKFDKGLIPF